MDRGMSCAWEIHLCRTPERDPSWRSRHRLAPFPALERDVYLRMTPVIPDTGSRQKMVARQEGGCVRSGPSSGVESRAGGAAQTYMDAGHATATLRSGGTVWPSGGIALYRWASVDSARAGRTLGGHGNQLGWMLRDSRAAWEMRVGFDTVRAARV